MISFEEFKKLDIKIGKIVKAEKIADSEKLVRLMVDLGEGEPRQIVAGIGLTCPNADDLVDKEIPVLCNLEPKTFLGYTSYGMLLAAEGEGIPVLLHPAEELKPGSTVK
ncbi:MAG: methionine--tRNA ligase [Candidatus Wildermuthbacteria bacterium]|nr:methionine--tRNA ligase [Candidatus Wildermuthbacteria bacterium]